MNDLLLLEIGLVATILWIGFVSAISFMEAWLKFRAPGITLQMGLGIGKLVFRALNKVEIFLALIIGVTSFLLQHSWDELQYVFYFIAISILFLQTFWLLPALDIRIKAHIENKPLPKSNYHIIFVVAELIKVFTLIMCTIHIIRVLNSNI